MAPTGSPSVLFCHLPLFHLGASVPKHQLQTADHQEPERDLALSRAAVSDFPGELISCLLQSGWGRLSVQPWCFPEMEEPFRSEALWKGGLHVIYRMPLERMLEPRPFPALPVGFLAASIFLHCTLSHHRPRSSVLTARH